MAEHHPQARKLFERIAGVSHEDLASLVAYGQPLPLNPTARQKRDWVSHVIAKLEELFDEQTIRQIRLACCCEEGLQESIDLLNQQFAESNSLAEFTGRMNELGADWQLKDGAVYTTYPSCTCCWLQDIELMTTKTWCWCTVGISRKIFESVLACPVEAELLAAIKLGQPKCVIKITPLGDAFAARPAP